MSNFNLAKVKISGTPNDVDSFLRSIHNTGVTKKLKFISRSNKKDVIEVTFLPTEKPVKKVSGRTGDEIGVEDLETLIFPQIMEFSKSYSITALIEDLAKAGGAIATVEALEIGYQENPMMSVFSDLKLQTERLTKFRDCFLRKNKYKHTETASF